MGTFITESSIKNGYRVCCEDCGVLAKVPSLSEAREVAQLHTQNCEAVNNTPSPPRLQPEHIESFLAAMRTLLYDKARAGKDLRIAQIVSNLGDNYYMEDAEYVRLVREAAEHSHSS